MKKSEDMLPTQMTKYEETIAQLPLFQSPIACFPLFFKTLHGCARTPRAPTAARRAKPQLVCRSQTSLMKPRKEGNGGRKEMDKGYFGLFSIFIYFGSKHNHSSQFMKGGANGVFGFKKQRQKYKVLKNRGEQAIALQNRDSCTIIPHKVHNFYNKRSNQTTVISRLWPCLDCKFSKL